MRFQVIRSCIVCGKQGERDRGRSTDVSVVPLGLGASSNRIVAVHLTRAFPPAEYDGPDGVLCTASHVSLVNHIVPHSERGNANPQIFHRAVHRPNEIMDPNVLYR